MFTPISKSLKTELFRKAVHLSSLWMPILIYTTPSVWCLVIFSTLLITNLLIEYAAYKNYKNIQGLFRRLFFKTLRPKEIIYSKFVPSGSVYILVSALICSQFFPKQIAVTALCIMLIADTAAALYGKIFGHFRFANGKSLEGSFAFFLSTIIMLELLSPSISPLLRITVAICATMIEFFEKELSIDDNLAIPLFTGIALITM